MPVKPLADLCIAVCMKNIREITDVGGLPYHIVRPILMRLDSADQLRAIEQASPHIALDDEECWKRLINKKFAVLHAQHNIIPRNPSSWYKVYSRYAKINDQAKAEAEAKLKAAYAGLHKKKQENASSIASHRSLPQPPRDMKNLGRKPAAGRRGGNNDTGELKFTAGSRTKTNSAASVMRRVKREAAEVSARNKLATPNGALRVRTGQIKQAPRGMVHEQSVKFNPAIKVQPPAVRTSEDEFRDRQMEEREERLRKLKANGANILEDSDVDDDDDEDVFGGGRSGRGGGGLSVDDLEDMFGDEQPAKPSPERRAAALPGKKRGSLLSNSYKGPSTASMHKAPASTSSNTQPTSRSTEREPSSSVRQSTSGRPSTTISSAPTSPPKPVQSANAPSGSAEQRPRVQLKRKPIDVFMKPKAKVQRR